MKQEILRCKGLTKIKHGGLVLNNLDFSLYEGEFLGLVGLNGSGRTTLAHALCGLDEVSQGQVLSLIHICNAGPLDADQSRHSAVGRAYPRN